MPDHKPCHFGSQIKVLKFSKMFQNFHAMILMIHCVIEDLLQKFSFGVSGPLDVLSIELCSLNTVQHVIGKFCMQSNNYNIQEHH